MKNEVDCFEAITYLYALHIFGGGEKFNGIIIPKNNDNIQNLMTLQLDQCIYRFIGSAGIPRQSLHLMEKVRNLEKIVKSYLIDNSD